MEQAILTTFLIYISGFILSFIIFLTCNFFTSDMEYKVPLKYILIYSSMSWSFIFLATFFVIVALVLCLVEYVERKFRRFNFKPKHNIQINGVTYISKTRADLPGNWCLATKENLAHLEYSLGFQIVGFKFEGEYVNIVSNYLYTYKGEKQGQEFIIDDKLGILFIKSSLFKRLINWFKGLK